jgi:hypothetical protein
MDIGPNGELASDGNLIYSNCAAVTYGYDGSGNLTTETLSQYGANYVKTYTWTGGKLVTESLWVKQ